MESSGSGPSASGHRNRDDDDGGGHDVRVTAGCSHAGYEPDCPKCHEFLERVRLRADLAWRFHLLSPDAARCAACAELAFALIRPAVLEESARGAMTAASFIRDLTRVVNEVVDEQFVKDLRDWQVDAWRACTLRLLQLACKHMGHDFGAPWVKSEKDDEAANVLYDVKDVNELERVQDAAYTVKGRLIRHFMAGKEVRRIQGLMDRAVKNEATAIKRRLVQHDIAAGPANPERALPFSALGRRPGPDDEEGPAAEIAAVDDALEQALEEPEPAVRERLIEALTAILEEQKTNRQRRTTPRQRAEMILDALTNPDVRYAQIAAR